MFSKAFAAAALAISASRLASAQTFTDCNPLEKTCPAEPALGNEKINCDMQSECKIFEALPGTTIEYDDNGMLFRIEKESNAPTIATHKRIFFGRLDVELRAAPGQGIVTSVVLESADLDEIDWEWLGGDDTQVQSNYFGKGDTTTYDRGGFHGVHSPTTTFHTYSIEWTSKKVDWIIDDVVVRTLTYEEAKGGSRFPQTPMEVKVGTWVAGRKDAPEGTVEWAGGYAQWDQAPFDAHYKSISIVDYAGGDSPTKDSIKEYVFGDKTGSWESIKVIKGDGSSDDDEDEDDEETTSAAPTSTKTKAPATTTTEADEEEETTTEEEEKTTKTTTTPKPSTTLVSTTSEAVNTTSSFAPTTSAAESTPVETTGSESEPTTVPGDGSGASAIAGSAAFAGFVALMVQFL
jgi:beta-glucanase (GH16 family)